MTTPRLISTFALCLTIACSSGSNGSATSARTTTTERTSVGTLPGSLVVLPGGDASYSIPIEVPPGRAGLEPALSFEYHSGVGNDWLGVGWGIGGLSTIQPCGRNHRDDGKVAGPFEGDTSYCLDGALLHPVADGELTSTGGKAEYRTRPDSFARVTRDGSDWVVERSDGTIDRYEGGVRTQRTDRSGNLIVFDIEGTDRPRLKSVGYNIAGGTRYANVSFVYADRPDEFRGWYRGGFRAITERLVRIDVTWNDELVRSYRLSYFDQITQGSTTGRSLLESIELCHGTLNGTELVADICLPPTRFRYQEGDPGIDPGIDVDLPEPDALFAHAVVAADISGDGSDDIVFAAETEKGARWAYARADRTVPSGFAPAHVTDLPTGEAKSLQVLEVNSDRLQDFVYLRDNTAFELLTGHPTLGLRLAQVFTAQPGETIGFLTAIDINGDGFRDVVTCEGTGDLSLRWVWYRNEGTVFLERLATDIPCRKSAKLATDIDENGATEIVDLGLVIDCDAGPVDAGSTYETCNETCPIDIDAQRQACLATFNCDIYSCDVPPTPAPGSTAACIPGPAVCEGTSGDPDKDCVEGPFQCSWELSGGTGTRLHTDQLAGPLALEPFHNFEGRGPNGPFLAPLATVDLVGDGTADLVFRTWTEDDSGNETSESLVVFLSKGSPAEYAETEVAGSLLLDVDAKLIRFIDWESDGDTDILVPHDNKWKLLSYELEDNGSPPTLTESVLEIGLTVTGQITVGDYDGDGLADLLINDGLGVPGDTTDRWWLYRHRNSTFRRTPARGLPDLLREVTNGFGETTSIDYRPLTDEPVGADNCKYPQRCDAAPRSVVAKHSIEDHPETRYSYFGPRADMLGRRDLGFERVIITAERGPGYEPATTWLEYDNSTLDDDHDAYRGAGLATRRTTWVGAGSNTSHHRVYQTVFDYQVIETIGLEDDRRSYFTHAQHTYERVYELKNGISGPDAVTSMTPLSERQIDVTRDSFGNVVGSTDTKNDNYLTGTETTYSNNASTWVIGKPKLHTQYSLAPGDNKARSFSLQWYANGLLDRVTRSPSDLQHRISVHYKYDEYGNPQDIEVTDRYGKTLSYHTEYDAFARVYPTHVTNPLHQTSATTWDFGFGVITRTADPMGVGRTYELDPFGRPRRVEIEHFDGSKTGEGAVITYVRRDAGPEKTASRMRVQTAPFSGRLSWTDYDQHGRVELEGVYLSTQATKRELDYDALDRVIAIGEPTWFGAPTTAWTQYEWDNHDRVTLASSADGQAVQYQYTGFTTTSIDAENRKTRHVHDLGGRLIEAIDGYGTPDASRLCYRYGAFDQVTKLIRGCGTPDSTTTTTYTYDPYGLKLSTEDPALGSWTYRYDGFDRLYESLDGNGQRLRYEYDDLHRRKQRLEVDTGAFASWIYDVDYAGTLYESSVSGGPTIRHQHDKFGRPSATTTIVGTEQLVESYHYDSSGRLAMTTLPAQPGLPPFRLAYAYSNRSLLIGLVDADQQDKVYWELEQIDPAGRALLESLGNGLQTKRTYDEVGRYTALRTDTPGNLGSLAAGPSGAFWETYAWDLSGNLESRTDHIGAQSETFEYDALSRLGHVTTTSGGTTKHSWATYDAFGNFTTRTGAGTYQTTPGGRVLSVDKRSYTYDGNGNVLNVDPLGDLGYTGGGASTATIPAEITWSALNKPLTIETPAGTTTITYSANGDVVRRVEPDRTVLRAGAYERVTAQGVQDRYRIVGPDGLVAQVTRVKQLGLGGGGTDPTSLFDETVTWVHSDHLGSPRALTDGIGKVVERLDYDAWGKPRPSSWLSGAPPTDQSLIDTDFGGHHDGGGFVDMGGRYYEPHSGVFLSPDPFIQAPDATQNLNRYIYVFQNPTSLIDPTGHFAQLSLSRGYGGFGGFGIAGVIATGAATSFFGDPGAWANGFRSVGRAIRNAGRKVGRWLRSLGDRDRGGGNEIHSSRSTAVSTEMSVAGGDGAMSAGSGAMSAEWAAIWEKHHAYIPRVEVVTTSDIVHATLDACGLVPGIGEACDLTNAFGYLIEGDLDNAALSASAMVPTGGQAITIGKWGAKAGSKAGKRAANQAGKRTVRTPANEPGNYVNTHASGKTYSGKGDRARSQDSARRVEKEFDDPHTATEWDPAPSHREAYKAESRALDANGGHKSPSNYNKIESPGKKYRREDGEIP